MNNYINVKTKKWGRGSGNSRKLVCKCSLDTITFFLGRSENNIIDYIRPKTHEMPLY